MRAAWLVGFLVASSSSCGGTTQPVPAQACGHGAHLVQTASSVIVSPADVPVLPPPGTAYFNELSSVAATPDGKTFLVTWTSSDTSSGVSVAQGHIVVAHRGVGGITTSAPSDAPLAGQAVFDGTDFLVVGVTKGPVLPGKPSSISLQRFGLDGRPEDGPRTIDSTPNSSSVSSAVWTPGGLAVAWYSYANGGSAAQSHVQLVGPDGTIRRDLALDPLVADPTNDRLEFAAVPVVATFGGQLVAARGQTISTLDWLGAATQTSQTNFVVSVPDRGPQLPTAFITGGKLMVWGLLHLDEYSLGLYAGTPGGSFTLMGGVSPLVITQQSDGCGGVVTLSNISNQTIAVAADASLEDPVRLGPTLDYASSLAVMTPTPSGFAVAWVATDGIHLTTLAWQ